VAPSGNIPLIDLSSSLEEGDFFVDTSWDEDFARQLFRYLNHDILELPDDGKVIILSNSDEEEDVCEETTTDAAAAPSTVVKSSTPAVSIADANEDLGYNAR
jgi:hypothetical protein